MNGNLIIDKDITTDLLDTGKLLGIIVIKDSYNVKTDYNKA
jgi:hypothetical protein